MSRTYGTGAAKVGETGIAGMLWITVEEFVATVVMNPPPVNTQNTAFREEVIAAFDSFTDQDDVRAAILTGFGAMFSTSALPDTICPVSLNELWADNPGSFIAVDRLMDVLAKRGSDA